MELVLSFFLKSKRKSKRVRTIIENSSDPFYVPFYVPVLRSNNYWDASHQTLGYLSPDEYEAENAPALAA